MTRKEEIGLNIKRARDSKGWSQQQLGEKLGLSDKTISKYENNGISDVEIIEKISAVLGQNVQISHADNEGIIGEVGREILIILIENKGHISFERLAKLMHGMSEERIQDECLKLITIGMCIRESYIDFDDTHRDDVFITAKGLIACKNRADNSIIEARIKSKIDETITYETLLAKEDRWGIPETKSYQAAIDAHRAIKLIVKLPFTKDLYRINFILHLKEQYSWGIRNFPINPNGKFLSCEGLHFTSISCYHDILYRKVLGLTNSVLSDEIYTLDDLPYEYPGETIERMEREDSKYDGVMKKLGIYRPHQFSGDRVALIKSFKVHDEVLQNEMELEQRVEKLSDSDKKLYEEYETPIYESELTPYDELREAFLDTWNEKKKQGISSDFPGDWYSTEEMIEFINEIFPDASSETEKQIDRDLAEIMRLIPSSKRYFFKDEYSGEGGLPPELEAVIRTKFSFQ